MPTTGHANPRYISRPAARLPSMHVDGTDLGPPLKPQDIMIWLRKLHSLEDREVAEAMRLGATTNLAAIYPELSAAEITAGIAAGEAATASRVVAWRRRNREMTWIELRVLFAGLRGLYDQR